jgi:hypothetical protein
MTRYACVTAAVLLLALGSRAGAAHDGDHFGPDGEAFTVGRNGDVKIGEDVVIGAVLVRKGKYILQHRLDRDAHILLLTSVADKSGVTRLHEISMRLIPSPDVPKKSALFAERLKDRSYRVTVVQIAGEGGDHVPEPVTTT